MAPGYSHTQRHEDTAPSHGAGVCRSQDSATGPRLLHARLEAESLRDQLGEQGLEITQGDCGWTPVREVSSELFCRQPGANFKLWVTWAWGEVRGGRLVRLQLTLASGALGSYVTEGWGPGYP